jgi:hypothetical protein
MPSPNIPEPDPVRTGGPDIWPLVIADIRTRFTFADHLIEDAEERNRIGTEKYGVPLQARNGRNPLVDAYQESLDLMVYLRQAIEEGDREAMPDYLDALRVGIRLRYRLLTQRERERVDMIQDYINGTHCFKDREQVRLEAIAHVDGHLARMAEAANP